MVVLREYTDDDIPLLVEYLNDEAVRRYLTSAIPYPYRTCDAELWVREGSRSSIVRAIEFDGKFVGDIGAFRGQLERSRTADTGYWIGSPFWNKGIATSALKQLTDCIFEGTDIVRLQSTVFQGNTASCRVLEKCGYRQDAVLEKAAFKNGQDINVHLYSCIST